MNFVPLVAAERADLARFLSTLTHEQWEHASLCDGWRVRDVVAHLIGVDEDGARRLVLDLIFSGFRVDSTNERGVRRRSAWSTGQLVAALERQITVGRWSRVLKGVPALLDVLIHHQDIRRPLSLARTIPDDRLRVALDAMAGDRFVGGRKRARGLRLAASDIEWTHGEGPEVRGPGEGMVMALAGRKVALNDLAGEGKDLLARRY